MQGGLADFELGGELGEGGTATVVRAIHRPTGTPVAIKSALMRSAPVRRALERELSAMARLHHPAILHLFDHGVAEAADPLPEGHAWMALELASGGSLSRLPPRTWPDVLEFTETLLEGLAHAHARGLIHRDLKPANMMRCVATDLRPGLKLADFGLAWAWEAGDHEVPRAGTPLYMAPEQILGEGGEFGPWTDLYALGAIVWRWVTGAPPFGWTRNPQQALRGHLRGVVPKLLPFLEGVPDGLEPLLRAMLQKEPMDRPQSAAQVLHWLHHLPGAPTGPPPIPKSWKGPERAGTPHLLHGAGLALFALRDLDVAGRNAERDILWRGLHRAVRESTTSAVLITGAPGAGASRLARWLAERTMETTAIQVHKAVPGEGGIAGMASRALALSLLPEEDQAHDIVRARLEMDLEVDNVRPVSFFRWLRREAETTPQVVWLDDVHRDEAALELLATLVYRNPDRPIFVVATAAEGDNAIDEVSNAEALVRISLGPLELRETMELVGDRLGLAHDLAAEVARRANGVPGLAVAWVRSWMDAGALVSSVDGFRRAPGVEMDSNLAPSADDARTERFQLVMSELGDNGRSNVLAGALLGQTVLFEEWLRLTAALGLSRREDTLRRLVRSGVATRSKQGWAFTDPGHRALALERLRASGEWEPWHRTASSVLARRKRSPDRDLRRADLMLECGQIEGAQILLRGAIEPLVDANSWRVLAWVAGRLRSCGDLEHPDPMIRFRVLQASVISVGNAQSPSDAVEHAVALAELASELPAKYRDRALGLGGQVLTFAADFDRAATYLARLDPSDPKVLRLLGVGALRKGDLDVAERHLNALLKMRDPHLKAIAHHELGNVFLARGDLEAAESHILQAVAGFGETDNPRAFVSEVSHCHVLIRRGEMDAAQDLAATALDQALETGSIVEGASAAMLVCVAALARGDDEAVDRTWPLALIQANRSSDHGSLLHCMERAYDTTRDPVRREKLTTLARHVLGTLEDAEWSARVNGWRNR